MLHLNFVQPKEFDHDHAAFFSKLMQERIEDDYNDFMILDKEEVLEFIAPAEEYVAYIIKLIQQGI